MFIQHHGAVQQKKPVSSGGLMLMSVSPTMVYLTPLGGACSDSEVTITATTGNNWTASITEGSSWIRIDGTLGGSANGSGNGSFIITATKYTSGSRLGAVTVTDSASHSVEVTVSQGTCP